MTFVPRDRSHSSNGEGSHEHLGIQMLWIHLQDVQGPGSRELRNKQNHVHKIMDGKDKDSQETKEKSYVIVVRNQDI
jgi:hypothetical protein